MATGRLHCRQSRPPHRSPQGEKKTPYQLPPGETTFCQLHPSLPSSLICALRLSQLQSARVNSSWIDLAQIWAETALQLPLLLVTLFFRVYPAHFILSDLNGHLQVGSFAFLWAFLHYYSFIPLALLIIINLLILYQEEHKSRSVEKVEIQGWNQIYQGQSLGRS